MSRPTMRAAARYFRVTEEQILGPRRGRHIVKVRAALVLVMRARDGLSYPLIGRRLGGRDHSTIIHCHEQGWKWMAEDEIFGRFVDAQLCLPRYSQIAVELPCAFPEGYVPPPVQRPSAPPRAPGLLPPCPARLVKLRPDETFTRVVDGASRSFLVDERGFSGEERQFRQQLIRGSVDLVAALRREHPERCAL